MIQPIVLLACISVAIATKSTELSIPMLQEYRSEISVRGGTEATRNEFPPYLHLNIDNRPSILPSTKKSPSTHSNHLHSTSLNERIQLNTEVFLTNPIAMGVENEYRSSTRTTFSIRKGIVNDVLLDCVNEVLQKQGRTGGLSWVVQSWLRPRWLAEKAKSSHYIRDALRLGYPSDRLHRELDVVKACLTVLSGTVEVEGNLSLRAKQPREILFQLRLIVQRITIDKVVFRLFYPDEQLMIRPSFQTLFEGSPLSTMDWSLLKLAHAPIEGFAINEVRITSEGGELYTQSYDSSSHQLVLEERQHSTTLRGSNEECLVRLLPHAFVEKLLRLTESSIFLDNVY